MIVYRNAEIKDIKKIIALEIECMEELKANIGNEFPIFDETRNNESSLVSIIEGGCGSSIIAEEDDYGNKKIVGAIIGLDKNYDNEQEIKDILTIMNMFVDINYRKQGIGTKLLEMVEEWAKEQNYIELQTLIYVPNSIIQNMTKKLGMIEIYEGRKKILDQKKYNDKKEGETIEYYKNRKEYLISKSNNRLYEM